MTTKAICKIPLREERKIRLKLEVDGKLELMREAARLGYTRFTLQGGVATLGFEVLMMEHRAHPKSPKRVRQPSQAMPA
jgi:hypothetical protein